MVILSLALWSVMRSVGPDSFSGLSSKLRFQTLIASGVFGVILGVASFWFDSNGASRGYLVHRGVSLSRIFLIRTLFGFMAFMLAMWIPLLYCGFYLSMIGPSTLPVTPYAIVPSLVAAIYSFGFFFAGSMIACRASHWFGSRLLPLLGALVLPITMTLFFPGPLLAFLLMVGLNALGLYAMWASARSAFLRGPGQPAPAQGFRLPMIERAMLLLSTVVASIVLFTLIFVTTIREDQPWQNSRIAITFESDGTPWLVEQPLNYPRNYPSSMNPQEQMKVLASLTEGSSEEVKLDPNRLQYGPELYSRPALANRFDTWDMRHLGESIEYAWWGYRGLVYFYQKLENNGIKQARLIAVVGPKSVGDLNNLPRERFSGIPVPLNPHNYRSDENQILDPIFWLAVDGVYQFDLESRLIQHVLPKPIQWCATSDKRISSDGGNFSSSELFVMNGHTISVYEIKDDNQTVAFTSEPIARIDLPRDVDLSGYTSGMFWFQDAKNWSFVPLKNTGNYDQKEFVVVRSKNDVIARSTIKSPIGIRDPSSDFSSLENQEMARWMLFLPPILVLGLTFIAFVTGGAILWNSLWLLGLVQVILSGVLCLLAARYRCLSNGRSLLWFVLGGLFGLGTWAAMLAIYPRVYRVRCANCGRMRRIENDDCEKCGATWEPLEPLGIELLSDPTNRPQYQPVAQGLVALMVGWSLLTDFDAIKRAGVPILRSLNIRFRLKQQARKQRGRTPVDVPEALVTRPPIPLGPIACEAFALPVRAT